MQEKKTHYKNVCNVKFTVISCIILFVLVIVSICMLIFGDLFKRIFATFLLTFIVIGLFGVVRGILKGKNEIRKENKAIKNTNPYLYYRELPNSFGIGVATLLFDSTIENEKDIVAVILDLCARKYLRLTKMNDQYKIEVQKPIDEHLLSNEKYILSCIIYDDIKNINFKEWYGYCLQDGIDLGLYVRQEVKETKKNADLQDYIKIAKIINICIAGFVGVFIMGIVAYGTANFLIGFLFGLVGAGLTFLFLLIPAYIILTILSIVHMGNKVAKENYKNVKENSLVKTQKGIEEAQKLYSFMAFLKDFGNFVEKGAEEVMLWDRYLSYAQVFGLTKEIMESGYEQLIHNASFEIDDFNEIYLEKIIK